VLTLFIAALRLLFIDKLQLWTNLLVAYKKTNLVANSRSLRVIILYKII
jgi:hypothetical protein